MTKRARILEPGRLIIASHNEGKVKEINALVTPYGIDAISAGQLGLPEPEETGSTFEANAILKANAAAIGGNSPSLADDSGLSVTALGGSPGIYSARWAGDAKDFTLAMKNVENALSESGSDDVSAEFVCALCLAWPDGHVETFVGRARGSLIFPPRGKHGFGYDPIFQPRGYDVTYGEMDQEKKHAISHRAAAFQKLENACLKVR